MKRIAYLFMALASVVFTMSSCEDVPSPYFAEEPDEPTEETVDPAGTGTLEDPYNVAMATQVTSGLSAGAPSSMVYVKGKISEIKEVSLDFGNATYYISDTGSTKNQYMVFRGNYLGGAKFTSTDQIKVGDEVIVYGALLNYQGNTPEFNQGSQIYSLNGKTADGGSSETGDVKTVTIAEFNAAEVSTDVWYQLTGTVKNLKDGDKYGNFDLVDETGSVYVYGLLAEKGGTKAAFQTLVADKEIKEGSKLTIIGNRGAYGDKIEVVNAYFVSIDNSGTTGGETTTGDNLLSNGDFETWADNLPTNWKSTSTASSATLSQSTDAHGGSYSVNVATGNKSNKRLGYKELNLKAGKYTFSFYAKATVGGNAQTRPGYVPVTDGKVGDYSYGSYTNITNSSWTLVSYEFTLDADATVCLVVMNPKGSGYMDAQDILIDDATLTTSNGGLQ